MQEPPEPNTDVNEPCDFRKIENIVCALDFLRGEAAKTGVDDVKTIVDSAFQMVLSAYTLVLRYHCEKNLPSGEFQ